MSAPKPVARTEAEKPAETAHLSSSQVEALEKSDEAEHETGKRREELTDEAECEGKAAPQEKPRAAGK